MYLLIWRHYVVRRYEILEDRLRFVGTPGSTTLLFDWVAELRLKEASWWRRRLRSPHRELVSVKTHSLVVSSAPREVWVDDPQAFLTAFNNAYADWARSGSPPQKQLDPRNR
jgi:hypothetical protein